MPVGKALGSMVAVAALALGACGAVAEEAAESTTTRAETTTTAPDTETTTTGQPQDLESGEAVVSDTIDPTGAVTGGNIALSHPGETYPSELAGIIGKAVTDLAGRLSLEETDINVVQVDEVTWSDGSHGCPQPGMSYTQAIVDGLRILLESNGQVYDYRSGGVSDPSLCEQGLSKEEPGAGQYELTEEGEVIFVPAEDKETGEPTEGLNPPDE